MSVILAIDPGPVQSGYVVYDSGNGKVRSAGVLPNDLPDGGDMLEMIGHCSTTFFSRLCIEMISSYGMPVGKEVFETCVWIGRFIERCNCVRGFDAELIYRRDVKMHLCGSARAKDANIRQALLDRFPATGGGKTPQIGTKSKPGPLYGIKSHAWAALGVAIIACANKTTK